MAPKCEACCYVRHTLALLKDIRCPLGQQERGHPGTFSRKHSLTPKACEFLVICQVVILWDLYYAPSELSSTMVALDMRENEEMLFIFNSLIYLIFSLFHPILQWSWWSVAYFVICGLAQWTPSASLWMCCTGRVHPWGVSSRDSASTHPSLVWNA